MGVDPRPLEVVARPEPTEVLVRVVAAGVNPVDVYTRIGVAYNRVLRLPFVNGWDVAGVVEEIGYGVTASGPATGSSGCYPFPGRRERMRSTSPLRHNIWR
jgi:NADPH:quinone reductase-like Zn-dependent oxidoreductase